MNISSNLILNPLSDLGIYRPFDILVRSLSCSSTAHSASRRDAEALIFCMQQPLTCAMQLILQPHRPCTILLFAQPDCTRLRAPFAKPCSPNSPQHGACGGVHVSRKVVMFPVVLRCLQPCGCPPDITTFSHIRQRQANIDGTMKAWLQLKISGMLQGFSQNAPFHASACCGTLRASKASSQPLTASDLQLLHEFEPQGMRSGNCYTAWYS
jgi:hypothetical protein